MIKPQFYSELLNTAFATEKEAVQAEKEYKAKVKLEEERKAEEAKKQEAFRNQRAKDAKAVDEAVKAAREASKAADKALNDFIAKYGSYHHTITDPGVIFTDFVRSILNF